MALLLVEGFEGIVPRQLTGSALTNEAVKAQFDVFWNGGGGQDQGSNAAVHVVRDQFNYGHALSFGEGGFSNGNFWEWVTPVPIDLTYTFYIGFRFKTHNTMKGAVWLQCYGYANYVSSHLNVRQTATGQLGIYRGGTLLEQTVGAVITANTWHYMEMSGLINSTTGTYEVKIDGTSVLSGTGVNTVENANNGPVDRFRIQSPGGASQTTYAEQAMIDDIYILDSTGITNNTYLGPIRVYEALPAEIGATSEWSSFGSATFGNKKIKSLREKPPVETSGIESSTSTDRQLYELDKFHTDNIRGISVKSRVKKAAAKTAPADINTVCVSGATTDVTNDFRTGDELNSNGAIATFGLDPNTSALWTKDNLNAAEFGVEVG